MTKNVSQVRNRGTKRNKLLVENRDIWIQLQRWFIRREFDKQWQGKELLARISRFSVATQILEVSGFQRQVNYDSTC